MSRSPIPRHRALLAGFCLAGALSAQAATQEEILDAALVSGDSSQLTDSHLVALRLQQQVERIRQTRTQLLDGLYQNLSQAYDPGAASMWVLPANPDNTLPFLIGDKGRVLASLSLEAGGRGLAYGTNVLTQLSGANAAHAPLLKRAVQWLVNGDPGAATAKDFKVSVVGVDKTAALNGLKSAGLQPADAACNALTDASCASASKLLVLGNGASAASLCAHTRASAKPLASGIDWALPASAWTCGKASASWARIASTGSTATTRAPVRASRRVNLPVPAPRSTATVCGRRPRASRSQSESASGYSGRPWA